eukprot:CAMPEP_0170067906 /NCGR_PEP_ID=MMETSP0019_2-20121128/7065_1 /TAXON_ID=98059 /ORGANISM="Dinobryon sp., Strain UTEXLB2267" /LENGTH=170 /DNA_ID=CAMNT_0010275387 /DNA_START=150 /DNA_END=658 /DNA_ORIENTATION=-
MESMTASIRDMKSQLDRTEAKIDGQSIALTRVEKGLDKVYTAIDKGVIQIREDLKNNLTDTKKLREVWNDCISRIEAAIEKGNTDSINIAVEYLKDGNNSFAGTLEASLRDAMNAQFEDMKAKLSQNYKIDQQQVLAELRAMQAQLAEVLVLTKDSRARLEEGLQMLRRT